MFESRPDGVYYRNDFNDWTRITSIVAIGGGDRVVANFPAEQWEAVEKEWSPHAILIGSVDEYQPKEVDSLEKYTTSEVLEAAVSHVLRSGGLRSNDWANLDYHELANEVRYGGGQYHNDAWDPEWLAAFLDAADKRKDEINHNRSAL